MRANLSGAAVAVDDGYWRRLAAAVRAEFRVDVYLPDRDDAVLGPGLCRVAVCDALAAKRGWCRTHARELEHSSIGDLDFAATAKAAPARRRYGALACGVAGCANGAGRGRLCAGHLSRWSREGRKDIDAYVAATGPVRADGPCPVTGCDRPGAYSYGLCIGHTRRWTTAGRPDLAAFAVTAQTLRAVEPAYDLSGLPPGVRLELQYALQCRHDDAKAACHPSSLAPSVEALRRLADEHTSLLDRPLAEWERRIDPRWMVRRTTPHPLAFLRFAYDRLSLFAELFGTEEAEHRAAASLTGDERKPP